MEWVRDFCLQNQIGALEILKKHLQGCLVCVALPGQYQSRDCPGISAFRLNVPRGCMSGTCLVIERAGPLRIYEQLSMIV